MTGAAPTRPETGDRRLLPYVVESLVVVAAFAVVGAGLGWLWFQVWDQPIGTVAEQTWYPSEQGLRDVFDATGWYAVLGVAGGAVLGAVAAAFARRSPLLTLAAVVVGSVLAGWVMHTVGLAVSPEDPVTLARTAADGTRLGGRLSLEGGESPYLAWPLGALVALMVVDFMASSREQIRAREAVDPQWLSPHRPG